MIVGLLMVSHEDDVLAATLQKHTANVDVFYALDGTYPNDWSRSLIESHPRCHGYWQDSRLPPEYGTQPRDGWRQWLLEHAYADHGHEHVFALLHADEVWTRSPAEIADEHPEANGFIMRLPVYFPQIWIVGRDPLEQLKWHLIPGWPEFRMFRGGPDVRYDTRQHFNVTPQGIDRIVSVDAPIRHYPYRSPETQRKRANHTEATGWDPDNYRHVLDHDEVFWTAETIERWQRASPLNWREAVRDP